MSQQQFNFDDRGKSAMDRSAAFDRDNLMAARKIVQNPKHYRGLSLDWAHRVIARLAPEENRNGTEIQNPASDKETTA